MSSGRRIPEVRGLPGTLRLALAGGAPRLHLYVDSNHKRLGPLYKDQLGGTVGYWLSEPAWARAVFAAEGARPSHLVPPAWLLYNRMYGCKRGLFFMEGDEWFKYRQIMNPIFLKTDLTSCLGGVYQAVTQDFLSQCGQYEGKEIENLEQILYKHSISFTIGHLLGTSYIKAKDYIEKDVERLGLIANAIFKTTARLMNLPVEPVAVLRLSPWKNFVQAVDSSLIASRKLTEKLLKIELVDGLLKEMLKQNISEDVLQALILDLMLAAGDTTAFTTQWCLYLLSQNETSVERLRAERGTARTVLRETLRLYPAACFLSRHLAQDLHLDGYLIPKGALVVISLYTVGRLESAYPGPERFEPGRWSRTKDGTLAGVRQPAAYLPFALGARSCIGRKIAEAQIYQTIVEVFSKFDLELQETVEMELQMVPVPVKPIRLLIRKRKG